MKGDRKSKACDLFHRDAAPEENAGKSTCRAGDCLSVAARLSLLIVPQKEAQSR
jgi:hypothetical protein